MPESGCGGAERQPDIEEVRIRVHRPAARPTLVYLPGMHGDWTLIGGFRRALGENVRFVEVTYPRTTTWSLDDYASGVQAALQRQGISGGWLLGESFGSQVVWRILELGGFEAEGVILAGGFARHPAPWMAQVAALLTGSMSFGFLRAFFYCYAQVARFRFRHSPETLSQIQEFMERRTRADCHAEKHRLELVGRSDPRLIAQRVSLPLYALTGLFDPIVPWVPARRWLQRNCPSLRAHRIIWRADHNVLGTAPQAAAAQVLEWLGVPGEPGVQERMALFGHGRRTA